MRTHRGALAAVLAAGALVCSLASPAPAADTFPSQDACHVTDNNTPRGNCGPFTQVYAENFNGGNVPVGTFSGCAGDGDFRCSGASGTRYYSTLGAYPRGWYDTANPKNHSNGNDRTFGGEYRPDTTMSVRTASNGDGQMRVHMFRPQSGDNNVAAPVPRPCMGLRYGKFTERFVVRTATDGFKMAHLRYTPNEIDYPEAGGNFHSDPVSEFTHGFAESGADAAPNAAWTGWHTYSTEIVPGRVRFYFDGKLFKTVNADFPDAADWVLQNESSLDGGYAARGASADIDTTWASCYRYTG
jgi:hypothetical protein